MAETSLAENTNWIPRIFGVEVFVEPNGDILNFGQIQESVE